MSTGPPDQPPSWWSRLIVTVGVWGVTLALTRVSPALQPSWVMLSVAAAGAVARPTARAGGTWLAHTTRLALTLGLLFLAGGAVAATFKLGWIVSPRLHARPESSVVVMAFWLWALRGSRSTPPQSIRTRPFEDAAVEVAEPLGMAVLATTIALATWDCLLVGVPAKAAWTIGAFVVVGSMALIWTWEMDRRRGPLCRSEGACRGLPSTISTTAVVLAGGRTNWRSSWLFALALTWVCAVVHWAARERLDAEARGDGVLAVKAGAMTHPADAWEAVVAAMAAIGPGDPCLRVIEKTANNQLRQFTSEGINPTYAEVWPSGRVALRQHHGPRREGCVQPELARFWIAQPAPSKAIEDMFDRLDDLFEPSERPCAGRAGRWCGISWSNAVHLYANGWFGCDIGSGEAERLPPETASALIGAIEHFAEARHALTTNDPSGLRVFSLQPHEERTLAVPRAEEIRAMLRRAICPAGEAR